jgi:peptidyl-prolyl cis-trans isomerase SurA
MQKTLLASGLFVVLGLATLAAAPPPHTEIVERVLVKVNGDILTQSDLESRQSSVIKSKRENPQSMTNAELTKMLADITPQVIVDAVDELLLLQRGRELGYHLTEEQFKKALDNIKKENKIETEEQFQQALKAENLTLAELRSRFEKSMIIQQVQGNEVLGRISVSEAEAKAYYEAHASEFTTPATVMLREIMIAAPATSDDPAPKAKADALLAQLKAGESFEKAVADESTAPSKANGGLIGPINLSDLAPALRKMIEPLKPGEMTPVVRTQSGYEIFKVETLREAALQPWDQAREDIGNRVANSKQAAEFNRYMQKLRAQAVLDWKNPELKKIWEQKVAEDAVVASAPPPPEKK